MSGASGIPKEVEISYEEQEQQEDAQRSMETLYRITIALKPGQVTLTQVITPYRMPFPVVSMICENIHAIVKVVEINGSVVRLRSFIPPKSSQCSAVILMRVVEGLQAKRVPL